MIAYFISCHNSAGYIKTLLRHIYRKTDIFLIHYDLKSPPELVDLCEDFSSDFENIYCLKPSYYSWAGFSQVETLARAMKKALEIDAAWSHFITLSEQHLPLVSPQRLDATLEGRGSLIECRSVAGMHDSRQDVGSRFAVNYRELPGVGCFSQGPPVSRQLFVDSLFHGSNWYIISIHHCSYFIALFATGRFDEFRSSVHSDEHALQTALSTDEAYAIATVENVRTTFVAWPHVTDNNDMIMVDSNFDQAISDGMLFIRKRPEVISESLSRRLSDTYDYGVRFGADPNSASRPTSRPAPDAVPALCRAIRAIAPGIVRGVGEIGSRHPLLHLRVDLKHHLSLSIHILSEDLRTYKVILVQNHDFVGYFLPYEVDEYNVSLIRARVYELFFQKEVLSIKIPDGGFVRTQYDDDLSCIIDMTRRQIEVAKRLRSYGRPL